MTDEPNNPPPTGGETSPPAGGDVAWYAKPELGLSDEAALFAKGHNFTDLNAALKYGAEAEAMARSRNVIEKPDPANLSGWKGWSELGWTEKVEDYKVEPSKELKNFNADPTLLDGFKKLAHEHRVPLSAANGIYNGVAQMMSQRIADAEAQARTEQEAAAKAASEALRSEWGSSYDTNLELAKRAARGVGLSEAASTALEKALAGPDGKGGSVELLKLFHGLGKRMGEAPLVGDGAEGGRSAMTPGEARLERLALEKDPEFIKVLNNPRDPLHADYTAKRQRLIKLEAGNAG
ncbi:hypothetical protein IP86_03000 [Rhodopseudomonas sp. AAP120]|uniref:hypothetical protein n=1 Tax=Rhodopseudomonas sp. AAP120 TaxID=1523430 RepID=UPI0006B94081|nr:hypothetical protein [Rhodopseudomonas sp. AAP120]KPG01792.1 hypothetical protein IP86_03000 [Rhodopseudomonas sp. AAP120]